MMNWGVPYLGVGSVVGWLLGRSEFVGWVSLVVDAPLRTEHRAHRRSTAHLQHV